VSTHELKTWPKFFDDVADGRRNFELRRDDRSFEIGDTLRLVEFRHAVGEYTGRFVERRISYILRGREVERVGLPIGFAILGLDQS
jgi:hypothetical protein